MTSARRTSLTAVLAVCGLAAAITAETPGRAALAATRPAATGVQLNEGLDNVSCLSATWCMAVGHTGQQALAQLCDGHTWTVLSVAQPATPGASLSGVSCRSRVSCIAVGGQLSPFQLLAEAVAPRSGWPKPGTAAPGGSRRRTATWSASPTAGSRASTCPGTGRN
ncbi:MAG TPA: hypothetical protein VGH27_06310 [Streptosporangiaceae bacterium]